MFDTRIDILKKSPALDDYNQKYDDLIKVMECRAAKTEFGGRKNLFASRIVANNEIVYTTRWRVGIEASMFVRDDETTMRIISVHSEGRRHLIHIKALRTDMNDLDQLSDD